MIAWRSTGGTPNSGRVEFAPIADGTRVSVAMEYEPEGVKASLGSALGADSDQVDDDLERFKELVESRDLPTGGWRGEIHGGDVVDEKPI